MLANQILVLGKSQFFTAKLRQYESQVQREVPNCKFPNLSLRWKARGRGKGMGNCKALVRLNTVGMMDDPHGF